MVRADVALAASILALMFGLLGGMAFQEWLDAPRLNDCLPGDRCTLHIEPKDAPWLNLTCDLTTNRCEDK